MVYKLLIVDNEPLIREGLRKIIDWNAYEIAICGEAESGRTGLESCVKLCPDIAIVDIKMPGMDGLQMIEEARNNGSRCHFILLTGYSDFSYAQKALRYGVDSYLLKPVEQEELKERIAEITKKLRERQLERKALETTMRFSVEKWVESIALGERAAQAAVEPSYAAVLGLPWKGYEVILIEGDRHPLQPADKEWLKRELQAAYDDRGRGIVFNAGHGIGVLANNCEKSVLQELGMEAKERKGLELAAAFGGKVKEFHSIAVSYDEAYRLMANRFFCGREHGILIPLPPPVRAGSEAGSGQADVTMEDCVEKIFMAVDAAVPERIGVHLADFETVLLRHGSSGQQFKAAMMAMLSEVVHRLAGSDRRAEPFSTALNGTLRSIDERRSLEELHAFLVGYLTRVTVTLAQGRPEVTLARMLEFIRRNCTRDIRLETLAALFNYNSSYLGKLFKSQTGKSFQAFLDDCRMEKAKQLLAKGCKVYEAAEQIGYANVDYFHMKFKKIVGISPSVFREKARSDRAL